jgi:DNA (cytosine-5)-methyltransferase 1
LGDVWNTKEVVSHFRESAFLATASFPCTDLSLAGNFAGFDGKHSSTYFGFIKALQSLKSKKPKLVMLENVVGFLTSKGGEDYYRAIDALAEEGYWIDTLVLDARLFVPQSRPRVFVIGVHKSAKTNILLRQAKGFALGDPWRDAIEAAPELRPEYLRTMMQNRPLATGWATLPLNSPKQRRYSLASLIDLDEEQEWWDAAAVRKHLNMLSNLHAGWVDKFKADGGTHIGTVYRRKREGGTKAEVRFDGIAGCLRTPRGGSARQIIMVVDKGKVRFRWMSPREYARLQGAPHFALPKNTIEGLFGFGDAVCVPVIRWLDDNVLTPLFEDISRSMSLPAPRSRRVAAEV